VSLAQEGVQNRDRALRLARRRCRSGGDQPEHDGQERAQTQNNADQQQDERLRVGSKKLRELAHLAEHAAMDEPRARRCSFSGDFVTVSAPVTR